MAESNTNSSDQPNPETPENSAANPSADSIKPDDLPEVPDPDNSNNSDDSGDQPKRKGTEILDMSGVLQEAEGGSGETPPPKDGLLQDDDLSNGSEVRNPNDPKATKILDRKTEILNAVSPEEEAGNQKFHDVDISADAATKAGATTQWAVAPLLEKTDRLNSIKVLGAALGLSLLTFAVYLVPFSRPLTENSEARTAVVARQMLESGDWVVPRVGEDIRLNKPPLPY